MTIKTCFLRWQRFAKLALAILITTGCVNSVDSPPSADQSNLIGLDSSEGRNDGIRPASLSINVGIVDDAREMDLVSSVLSGVKEIYDQCQISVAFHTVNIELEEKSVIDAKMQTRLVSEYKAESPAVFFVSGTAEEDVAFAYLPSLDSSLASSMWVTNRVSERCLTWITAHEIGHVLLDNAQHSGRAFNVMSTGCKLGNWNNNSVSPRWMPGQCVALRRSPFLTD